MRKEGKVLLLSLSFVFLSLLFSYLVNVYNLTKFILILPLLLMFIVLAYAGFYVKRLLAKNEKQKAVSLVVVLMMLVLISLIVLALSFNRNNGFDYPPGVLFLLSDM
jgi:4-hydroxybenzoate polyprenyltransferase